MVVCFRLFPEYFYSFLQSYMQMFSSMQILPPDDKIMRLYSDINQIIDIFLPANTEQSKRTIPDDDGLILITAVVTSCIRGLKYCKTKLHCLEILQQLSMYTTSETVLDRILPYIVCESGPNAIECYSQCFSIGHESSFVFFFLFSLVAPLQ